MQYPLNESIKLDEKSLDESVLLESVVDEYGVIYSKDSTILLKAVSNIPSRYIVREETKVICNEAFKGCYNLTSIDIPDSITIIGEDIFLGCI